MVTGPGTATEVEPGGTVAGMMRALEPATIERRTLVRNFMTSLDVDVL